MDYGIFSPKLSQNETMPKALLSEAFVSDDSVNIYERYGEYRKKKGRLADLYDSTNSAQIQPPTDVFAITNINAVSKTITITGDHSAGNTALAVGDTIRINGNTTTSNNVKLTVASLPGTSTIVVNEAITATHDGNVFVGTTPVLAYHLHENKSSGAKYLLLGTAYNIFLWTYSDRSLAVKFTCSAECSRWEFVTHQRNVYATNNVDVVQWWNVDGSVANNFAALGSASGLDVDGGTTYITKAKHITSYETYLFVGNITYSDSTVYPYRIAWASRATGGATIDFQYTGGSGDAGNKDFSGSEAGVRGFARYKNYLIVATGPEALKGRIYEGWLVTSDDVFRWSENKAKIGVLSADAMVNDGDGELYYIATDLTIRQYKVTRPISNLIDKTIKMMNTSVAEYFQGTYINEYNRVCFSLAIGSATTNNTLIEYDPITGKMDIHEIPVRCFGKYTQQEAFGYDTLSERTYEDWGAGWLLYDTEVNVAGWPLEICSDYSGKIYDLNRSVKDAGSNYQGDICIATSLGDMANHKRVNNGAYLYFNRKSSGSASLYLKRDGEESWQSLGSASFEAATLKEYVRQHVNFDKRFISAEFKISSTDDMEFIGMSFLDFELDDER